MNIRSPILLCFVCLLSLFSSVRFAHADFTCHIDFAYGLVVNDTQIRVMDKTRTVMQINDQSQLFIEGRMQQLDSAQQDWLRDYASGLHYVVPKMIILANEGVELAIETIDNVYLGLVGSDHESYQRLSTAMKRVQNRVKDKFRHASNHYFIGPGSLESVDDYVDAEIEAQLEEAISTSVGGILSAIAGINSNNGDVNGERVEQLSRQIEAVGEQIEADIAPKTATLKNKAKWFCDKLKKLDKAEENLRNSVPAMRSYNVITIQPKTTSQTNTN